MEDQDQPVCTTSVEENQNLLAPCHGHGGLNTAIGGQGINRGEGGSAVIDTNSAKNGINTALGGIGINDGVVGNVFIG